MPRGFVSVGSFYLLALPYSATQKATNSAPKRLILPIALSNRLIGLFSRFTVKMNAMGLVAHETVQNRQILKGLLRDLAKMGARGGGWWEWRGLLEARVTVTWEGGLSLIRWHKWQRSKDRIQGGKRLDRRISGSARDFRGATHSRNSRLGAPPAAPALPPRHRGLPSCGRRTQKASSS